MFGDSVQQDGEDRGVDTTIASFVHDDTHYGSGWRSGRIALWWWCAPRIEDIVGTIARAALPCVAATYLLS